MPVGKSLTKTVNPWSVAIAVVGILAIITLAYWKGLVWKKVGGGGPMGGGPSARPGDQIYLGYSDVQVDTLSGDPEPGSANGPGRDARFDGPAGLAIDSAANLYVADVRNNSIRMVKPDGTTSTLAGSVSGYRDGDAPNALFDAPCGVAVAPDGTVYVADTGNDRIRCIKDGRVSTIAGSTRGSQDGPGANARFDRPCAISWDGKAFGGPRLLVSDAGGRDIRSVSLAPGYQVKSVVLHMPTLASYVAGADQAQPRDMSSSFLGMTVALPGEGALEVNGSEVRGAQVAPNQNGPVLQHPLAACRFTDQWMVVDSGHGAVFELDGKDAQVVAGSCSVGHKHLGFRDGTGNRCAFGTMAGIVYDGKGHLYVTDEDNNAIRRLTLPITTAEAEPFPN